MKNILPVLRILINFNEINKGYLATNIGYLHYKFKIYLYIKMWKGCNIYNSKLTSIRRDEILNFWKIGVEIWAPAGSWPKEVL